MFCVMTVSTLPRRTSAATARWPRLGRAARNTPSLSKRRRHDSMRASSESRKLSKSMGTCFVHRPPGLRKSGMPDSVLMPAPVKTTARRALAMRRASAASDSSVAGSGVPLTAPAPP